MQIGFLALLLPIALSPAPTLVQAPTTVPQTNAPTTTSTGPAAQPHPLYHDPMSQVDVYDVITTDMFPAAWRVPPIAASAQPMAETERERALRLVKVALSKYPPQFLQANLKQVYLVGGLKFKGISAAATNSTNCLYIEVAANNPAYTDQFIENSVHHEFGHLLQRKYRKQWSRDAWSACNPPGFRYGSASGVDAVLSGHASGTWTDDWNRKGFLSEYGASNASEDFATIAAKLLLGDSAFWNRVDMFPALKAKVAVTISFYTSLNNRFTETYFRNLHVGVPYLTPLPPTVTTKPPC